MKKFLLALAFITAVAVSAQTRHVLLEEFTGAHCGLCPNGAYYTDSMLAAHPDLIAVAVHTYGSYDAMVFPAVDTIGQTFAGGAPLGAVDRICPGPPSTNTGQYINMWDGNIQQREAQTPLLTVDVVPTWNSSSRIITASVTVNVLANMSAGDYRISLYVVEDSVVGTGSGYDQANSFDQVTGSQWYGLGDPIVGYIHRHVARALLPSAWGRAGVIPSTPMNGQTFNTTFNYTLPAGYNENRVHVVAFVNKVTSNHEGDEVMNASEEKLIATTSVNSFANTNMLRVYPNPCSEFIRIDLPENMRNDFMLEITDISGRVMWREEYVSAPACCEVDVRAWARGVYFIRMRNKLSSTTEEFICD